MSFCLMLGRFCDFSRSATAWLTGLGHKRLHSSHRVSWDAPTETQPSNLPDEINHMVKLCLDAPTNSRYPASDLREETCPVDPALSPRHASPSSLFSWASWHLGTEATLPDLCSGQTPYHRTIIITKRVFLVTTFWGNLLDNNRYLLGSNT